MHKSLLQGLGLTVEGLESIGFIELEGSFGLITLFQKSFCFFIMTSSY